MPSRNAGYAVVAGPQELSLYVESAGKDGRPCSETGVSTVRIASTQTRPRRQRCEVGFGCAWRLVRWRIWSWPSASRARWPAGRLREERVMEVRRAESRWQ